MDISKCTALVIEGRRGVQAGLADGVTALYPRLAN